MWEQQTEGVGTTPIGESLPAGIADLPGEVSVIDDSGSESDLSDLSDDELEGEDEEGEKDLSITSASESEGGGEGVDEEGVETAASVDYFNTIASPEPADHSTESISPLMSPLSIADTPSNSNTPSTILPSSSQHLANPEMPVPLKSIHARRGLRLPSFMKRTGSSKSVNTRLESEGNSDAGPSGSGEVDGSTAATKEKEKGNKKRFSRKKSRRTTREGEGAEEEVTPKAARRRLRKSGGTTSGTTGTMEGGSKLKRRQTKRDYRYEAEDNIFGLVQIGMSIPFLVLLCGGEGWKLSVVLCWICDVEIKSAHNLPRFHNMLRTSWDMDPFVVCSFGRKIFRTRLVM